MSVSHITLAVLLTVLWGFVFVVMRDLLDTLPPLLLSTLRVVAAGMPVLVLLRLPRIAFYWVLLLGATQGVIQMSLLLFGMQLGMPAGLAALVLQMQVLFMIHSAAVLVIGILLCFFPFPRTFNKNACASNQPDRVRQAH